MLLYKKTGCCLSALLFCNIQRHHDQFCWYPQCPERTAAPGKSILEMRIDSEPLALNWPFVFQVSYGLRSARSPRSGLQPQQSGYRSLNQGRMLKPFGKLYRQSLQGCCSRIHSSYLHACSPAQGSICGTCRLSSTMPHPMSSVFGGLLSFQLRFTLLFWGLHNTILILLPGKN